MIIVRSLSFVLNIPSRIYKIIIYPPQTERWSLGGMAVNLRFTEWEISGVQGGVWIIKIKGKGVDSKTTHCQP